MPITFAHPAAAVPLRRLLGRYACLPALVLGSMAPDFPYFLPLVLPRGTTHSLASIAWYSVPAGFLAYVLFDRLLKAPLLFLLPLSVRRRMPPYAPASLAPGAWPAICVSTAAGALTHLIWDSFTHYDGAAVARLPQLRESLAHAGGLDFPVFKLLQLGSSLAGTALLGLWVWRWMRRTPPATPVTRAPFPESTRAVVVAFCLAAGLAAGLGFAALRSPEVTNARAFQSFLRHSLVSSVATAAALLLAFSLAWKHRARRAPARRRSS